MKAMLLTAGFGERMYPLTDAVPKPGLPVLGRPLAAQLLAWLGQLDPECVVLNLHHLPDYLPGLLADGVEHGLPRVRYSHEEELLGTAGGMRHARGWLSGSGTIVVSNADSLSDIDLHAALATHRASGLPATLVLAPRRAGYSGIEVDARGRILSLAGKPAADSKDVAETHLYTGCQILEEEVLDRIPPHGPSDIVLDVHRQMAAEGLLGSHLHQGFWWEFGSPRLYLEGSLTLLESSVRQRRRITPHDPIRRLGESVAAIGRGARYHPSAEFKGRMALGLGSHVSERCCLENCVVMPEAWVGPSSRVHCSVIGPGVELPEGSEFEWALICRGDGREPSGPDVERVGDLLVRRIGDA